MQLPVNLFMETCIQITPTYFYGNRLSGHETLFCKHFSRPENVAFQSPGLIQNCNRKPEGRSRPVTILLCKYQSAAQKSFLQDEHVSLLHKKFSPWGSNVSWALTTNSKQRMWFSQRSVSNHKTMTEKGPHLFHHTSLGKTEEPGEKTETEMSLDFHKTLSVTVRSSSTLCWWSLSILKRVYMATTMIQQHGGARGTNSTGQLMRDTQSIPEATGFLSSHYLN